VGSGCLSRTMQLDCRFSFHNLQSADIFRWRLHSHRHTLPACDRRCEHALHAVSLRWRGDCELQLGYIDTRVYVGGRCHLIDSWNAGFSAPSRNDELGVTLNLEEQHVVDATVNRPTVARIIQWACRMRAAASVCWRANKWQLSASDLYTYLWSMGLHHAGHRWTNSIRHMISLKFKLN
jgi:hypothetical protein